VLKVTWLSHSLSTPSVICYCLLILSFLKWSSPALSPSSQITPPRWFLKDVLNSTLLNSSIQYINLICLSSRAFQEFSGRLKSHQPDTCHTMVLPVLMDAGRQWSQEQITHMQPLADLERKGKLRICWYLGKTAAGL